MRDKELFDKIEETFKLNTRKNVIDEIYSNGKFKRALDENTSPIKSNYGRNTISAARGAGSVLGKIARSIPGTRGHKMRSAEARKKAAEAKMSEIQAQQARASLTDFALNEPDTQNVCKKLKQQIDNIKSKGKQPSAKLLNQFKKLCTLSPADKKDKLKVNDLVLVNTAKSGKKQAIIRQILPDGRVQLSPRNGTTYMGKYSDIIGKIES